MTSDFRRQRTRTEPFGDAGLAHDIQPDRVVIETRPAKIIAEQQQPAGDVRRSRMGDPWTSAATRLLQRLRDVDLLQPAVPARRTWCRDDRDPVDHARRAAHSGDCAADFRRASTPTVRQQSLYFDDGGLLRRHDYQVDVAGGTRAAHLISDYIDVQGLRLPTRRRVFLLNADGTLQLDRAVVTIDLSDFRLS